MRLNRTLLQHHFSAGPGLLIPAVLTSLVFAACAGGPPELPDPRPIVIRSGARLYPDEERLREIDTWFRPEMRNIETDPGFLIEVVDRETPAYPWETLLIQGDTAKIGVATSRSLEAQTAYMIYAHLHLMKVLGRLDEFLPEAAEEEGFLLERAILSRVADAWFLGRGAYDAEAYDPLEELMYAKENGYLDAFLLTARGDEFSEERKAWLAEDPEALERYRAWFVETFEREPPGLRNRGE